jgi:DNA-binding LacI/PurR family transcriptional regulator
VRERAAQALGLRVPEDLSLVSFDDAPWMTMVTPGVTAVAQDAVALGEAAVAQMFERIQSPESPKRTVMLSAAVAQRGSTAAPSEA